MESIHLAAYLGHSNFPSVMFLTLSFIEWLCEMHPLQTVCMFVVKLLSRISHNIAHIKSHVSSVMWNSWPKRTLSMGEIGTMMPF